MDELLAILMSWAATLSGYSRPVTAPEIVMVPHTYLVAEACGGHECRVLGWYPPGPRIFLDDRLDPVTSLYASSIVVHELVHFLQQQSGRFEEDHSCDSAIQREREAYAVQREFLLRSGAYQPIGASMHSVGCELTAPEADARRAAGSSNKSPHVQPFHLPQSTHRRGDLP
jgi:hypothetical protein